MKTLNSPFLFAILLCLFFWLALYAYTQPYVAVQKDKQTGYTHSQNEQMERFVAFRISSQPIAVYHPKTQLEAAEIVAGIWGVQ